MEDHRFTEAIDCRTLKRQILQNSADQRKIEIPVLVVKFQKKKDILISAFADIDRANLDPYMSTEQECMVFYN